MIQRYNVYDDTIETEDDGEYVLYTDHLAVIEEKDKEIAILTRLEQEQREKKEWYHEEHAKCMKEIARLKEEYEQVLFISSTGTH